MTEPATLSVVIPAFNAERFLERAVESVFATGYPGVTVEIVDDGSADGTLAVAERLAAVWSGRCRVLSHIAHANLGVSASRNLGIRASESEWVALLDADDYYLPHRFESLRRFLAERRSFDAIYELCEVRGDAEGVAPTPRDDRNFGIARHLTGAELLRELLRGACWATSAITMRRTLLERTGLFDTRKRIAEDCDLWFRIAAAGEVVPGNLEAPVSVYWRHAANTYHYDIGHRVAMVRAMLEAWQWTDRHPIGERARATFAIGVERYVHQSIMAARSVARPEIAWKLISLVAGYRRFGLLTRIALLKQLAALLRLPLASPVNASVTSSSR